MDTIADMLVRIKNAQAVSKKTVNVPYSKINYEIAKILEEEGFVEEVKKRGRIIKKILIILKYNDDGSPRIREIKRVSKPSRRIYLKYKDIFYPKSGYGILILSTPKGILTAKKAKRMKVGGEVLCEVW